MKVPPDFRITPEHRNMHGVLGTSCVPGNDPLRPRFSDNIDGPRRGGRPHDGIDIFALQGAWVVSTTPGRVVTSWWIRNSGRRVTLPGAGFSADGGNFVRIRDPDGFIHYYAHLLPAPPRLVRSGDAIQAGEVLGLVGRTGRVFSCPHLHYQVRAPYRLNPGRGGARVNPYEALRTLFETDGWQLPPLP